MKNAVRYKQNRMAKSAMTSVEVFEGESIEQKIERIMSNNEPITDGAPIVYTDAKDGVISAYNIRTDRWEIAAEAMDTIAKNTAAKAEEKAKAAEAEAAAKGQSGKEGGQEGDSGQKSAA